MVLAALAWPAVHTSEVDSLPFSNYPMFAHERERVSRFHAAVLIEPDGTERRLDPHEVAGTDQPVQAAMTVRQAIGNGDTDVLCEEIAAGIDAAGTIEVLSVRYDSVAWFRGDQEPVERTVHARCPSEASP